MAPDNGHIGFWLGIITHPKRHLNADIVSVGEHPPERLLDRPNGQRMIGALRGHFQNLAIKQLNTGPRWESAAGHQLIVFCSSPSLRAAHCRSLNLV